MNKLDRNEYADIIAVNVDIQNDFCPGGALGVDEGDLIIPHANTINEWVRNNDGYVVFTRDWHPRDNNKHFVDNGGPWPVHCVQYDDTLDPQAPHGAGLRSDLVITHGDAIASKGTSGLDDGYSGYDAVFEPNESKLGLVVKDLPQPEQTVGIAIDRIQRRNAELGKRTAVVVFGIAGDFCVPATAAPMLERFDHRDVDVIMAYDAIRSVNLTEGDGERALQALYDAKAIAMSSEQITKQLSRQ